jgi:hypothetical protein
MALSTGVFPSLTALFVVLTAGICAGQVQHREIEKLAGFLSRCEETTVGYLKLGDSRSSWRKWRDTGSFYRQFDVKHAALVLPATEANNGSDDGLGGFQLPPTGTQWTLTSQGGTTPNSGIVNRYPATLGEMWFVGPPNNPQWNRWYILSSTAGFDMDSSQSGGTGGQFKRGDPSLGRPLSSVEFWYVSDDQPGKWLNTLIEVGYSSPSTAPPFNESGALSQLFPSPSVPSGVGITRFETSVPVSPATGLGIRARLRHFSGFAAGKGNVLLGMRLNFGGASSGVVFAQVAQGGWSHSDHMPSSVIGPNDNPDAKYDFERMVEWLQTAIRTEYLVIDEELGQNMNLPGNFSEWNGLNLGSFRQNKRIMIQRWIDAALAAGFAPSKILVVSRIPWRGQGDDPARIDSMRSEVLALHATQPFASSGVAGYVVYDQQEELESRGLAEVNGPVLGVYRDDDVHQNFAGMNMLGEVMWSVIQTPRCDSIDFNRDGSFFDPVDIDALLSVFSEGPCMPETAACGDIDFNNDGSVFDPCDIDAFLLAFSEGPCSACGQ